MVEIEENALSGTAAIELKISAPVGVSGEDYLARCALATSLKSQGVTNVIAKCTKIETIANMPLQTSDSIT
jgi:hypothetical protein